MRFASANRQAGRRPIHLHRLNRIIRIASVGHRHSGRALPTRAHLAGLFHRFQFVSRVAHNTPVVVDHMGRTDAAAGIGASGFQSLLRYVGNGECWVKVSGAHRLSQRAPDYEDARPFHEALVRANPERLVWGSDWPHPRMEGEMPDAGHLFELLHAWTPDQATRQRILVANPAKLYGFA